jgi:hypothetical protein
LTTRCGRAANGSDVQSNVRGGYRVRSALSSDISRLPEIERAASVLFAEFGLADLFARVLTPLRDLE